MAARRLIAIVLAGGLALGTAHAQARGGDTVEKARIHFRAGEAHFQAGSYDQAIAEYQAAYALVNKPELLFDIGSAYRRKAALTHDAADKRAAIEHYERYLESDPSARTANDATTYIASLSRELAEETAAPLAPEPPPVAAPVPPPIPPAPPAAETAPADRGSHPSGRGYRVAGIATAGVGAALLATSVVFAFQARSASSELAGLGPGDAWDPSLRERGRSAQRNAYLCAGAGAAAVAGGAVLYFVLGRPAPVAASLSRTGATLSIVGRF